MKIAESVTFGGAGLDRSGMARRDPEGVAALQRAPSTRFLALWRGKPLIDAQRRDRLIWLEGGDPLLEGAPVVFLCHAGGTARFAADVSAWTPAEADKPEGAAFFDASEQPAPGQPGDHRFVELRGVMAGLSAAEAEMVATGKSVLDWHNSHRFCSTCGAQSRATSGGWQRDCDACGRHHFPRCDPVVIMLVRHGNDVLLGRSHHWPEGMYSLLAGFVEPGETIEAAVRREVAEETGVRVGEVGYLASQPWPYPSSLMIGCHGRAESRDLRIDPVEIDDALWLSREEVMDVFAGRRRDIAPARHGSIARFLLWNWLADRLD